MNVDFQLNEAHKYMFLKAFEQFPDNAASGIVRCRCIIDAFIDRHVLEKPCTSFGHYFKPSTI